MTNVHRIRPHAVLKDEQRSASDPAEHVWLSASAGTGKTYVLSARVLRLLLRGAHPDTILCLTFTKAGAAEMAERVHQRLAYWVRLDDTLLFNELEALGEDAGPGARARARTLFARVLEARGGGLRIMTIHAFCQTLLGAFPIEAGLAPGFRPIEGREEAVLGQSVLTALVLDAEREGEARLLDDLSALSLRLGEEEARNFLRRAAKAGDALDALPGTRDGIRALVRRAMDVPAEHDASAIEAACDDAAFDKATLLDIARMNAEWGTKTGEAAADRIAEWLLGSPVQRAAEIGALALVWATREGDLRKGGPKDPGYADAVARMDAWCRDLTELAARADLADAVTAALNAGRRYAQAYAAAKRVRGLVDFDDLIRLTVRLLQEPGIGDWIRYKLDQATDHILVDEAQDTNLSQWEIIAGLAAEFFAGEGARDATLRTIFTVGDFKQAIFGFQGTDPDFYRLAHGRFAARAQEAGRGLLDLSLSASFRSGQTVLDVVDAVIAGLGPEALGLDEMPPLHASHGGRFGRVSLLPPVTGGAGDADPEGEEDWIDDHVRVLAATLARQVKAWLDAPPLLRCKEGRPLGPGDIMILVRKRGELASLLVARLQEEGVPVAGVDRLRLKAPLVVKDLLAAMRFAVQRADDLTLASLLVSPIFGWTQEALFAVAHGRKGTLWDAIPDGATREGLVAILNAADRMTPFAFLEQLLSGPLKARQRLTARLGEEARDPIDELLSAALAFGRENTPSLQGFLDWFDRGEGEIVRDAGGAGDAVRVLTVHGSKGLEAPLVVLADAAGSRGDQGKSLDWVLDELDAPLPLFRPKKAERTLVPALATAADDAAARETREHWRLLYVAMTRAAEHLVVAGSLGVRAKGEVPPDSWYAAIGAAMDGLGAVTVEDAVWGTRLDYAAEPPTPARAERNRVSRAGANAPVWPGTDGMLPGWLHQPAPPEARPPRPLAPSSLGPDEPGVPPASAALAAAALRGRLLHGLFERLPPLAPEVRRAAGLRWLAGREGAEALVASALAVIGDPALADLFAPDGLAEAPVAGVVDGLVVAGTVDRLVVGDTRVTVIDFKTGRRVPPTTDAIPAAHLRQMAAYVAVLAQVFPGRRIEAALLYSEGPVVHRLPEALLAAHKPGLGGV